MADESVVVANIVCPSRTGRTSPRDQTLSQTRTKENAKERHRPSGDGVKHIESKDMEAQELGRKAEERAWAPR